MAIDLTPTGMVQLASPTQAATLFNPDGAHPIRQKHMFLVQFVRAGVASLWQNGLSFVVKSIDRPQVQPVVEELNQYNKKRLIHTGVKYSPINCSFLDTADGAAMNMWLEYARYYFGDYDQSNDSYNDDILNNDLFDSSPSRRGFGFNIRPTNIADPVGIGSQNFFKSIRVLQLWGNEYTSFELVNPRLNSFTPDELSYESSEANTIQISIQYEAINHINTGRSKDLMAESELVSIFEGGPFDPRALEVDGHGSKTNSFVGVAVNDFTGSSDPFSGSSFSSSVTDVSEDFDTPNEFTSRTTTSSEGGVLNRFGLYDFGTTERSIADALRGGVSSAIGGSPTLSNLLRGNFSGLPAQATGASNTSIESTVGNAINYVDGLAEGLRAASAATGVNPYDLATRAPGLVLSPATVAGVNQTRSGTSQIGTKTS